MNPERWEQIEKLYHATLEREPGDRMTFLDRACAGDETLRRQVAALLACDDRAASFIESPVLAFAAGGLAGESLATAQSQASARIGAYQILSLLGRGGMGEVHLAYDTRLDRKVAVKLLPAEFTSQPERVRRFAPGAGPSLHRSNEGACTVIRSVSCGGVACPGGSCIGRDRSNDPRAVLPSRPSSDSQAEVDSAATHARCGLL
ncbi:MAG: hypothetical protein MOB07_15255 [Acidobacteria bacterium]|nr:hypothetical protein [Acidobacteriota bacterium]